MANFGGAVIADQLFPAPGADVADIGEPLDFGRVKSVIRE
jgi:hypothetical protein